MHALTPSLLLDRLDAIGRSLAKQASARALIGLGSAGQELERLDRWSDLDFFVIVDEGAQERFLSSLDWLADAAPLLWHFRNTPDGHKAWMTDGVFCEFAVFAPSQLPAIAYAPGRTVWARSPADAHWEVPVRPVPAPAHSDPTWLLGELLGNLQVGLLRWHRGERLAGSRLVQVHALDRLISLVTGKAPPGAGSPDPFNAERRLEQRFPEFAANLPELAPGIDHTPRAALAMLAALQAQGIEVPAGVEAGIRTLCSAPSPHATRSPT